MTDIAGYCDIVFSFPPLVGDTVRELSYNKTLIRYWTQANTVRVGDFKSIMPETGYFKGFIHMILFLPYCIVFSPVKILRIWEPKWHSWGWRMRDMRHEERRSGISCSEFSSLVEWMEGWFMRGNISSLTVGQTSDCRLLAPSVLTMLVTCTEVPPLQPSSIINDQFLWDLNQHQHWLETGDWRETLTATHCYT